MRSGWHGNAAARKQRRLRRQGSLVDREDDALVAVVDQQQTIWLIRLLLEDLPHPLEPTALIRRLEQRGAMAGVWPETAD
jgi:hypothetical protein